MHLCGWSCERDVVCVVFRRLAAGVHMTTFYPFRINCSRTLCCIRGCVSASAASPDGGRPISLTVARQLWGQTVPATGRLQMIIDEKVSPTMDWNSLRTPFGLFCCAWDAERLTIQAGVGTSEGR